MNTPQIKCILMLNTRRYPTPTLMFTLTISFSKIIIDINVYIVSDGVCIICRKKFPTK